MHKILLIDDDEKLADLLNRYFAQHDLALCHAAAPSRGFEMLKSDEFALIILDIMLPEMDGFEVCRRLRQTRQIPILMLTARSEEADRVLGLDLGADDYVTKPFSVAELMARCRALLRRIEPAGELPGTLVFGDVKIDFERFLATRAGRSVHLSPKGFGLLRLIAAQSGTVVSRELLLNQVWGYDALPTTRTVDNQVAQLRAALEEDPSSPRHIITVHGVGYRFEPEPPFDTNS